MPFTNLLPFIAMLVLATVSIFAQQHYTSKEWKRDYDEQACTSKEACRPNIILLLADDMGYGDLHVYGHPTQEPGPIDLMAKQGLRFTNWLSADSVCTPSRAAVLTGRLPVRIGIYSNHQPFRRFFLQHDSEGLPKQELTIPEILKKANYTSGIVGKWHLGINKHTATDGLHLPMHHGFDFVGTLLPLSHNWFCDEYKVHVPEPQPQHCFKYNNDTLIQQPIKMATITAEMLSDATKFIMDNKHAPFFFYFSFPQTHASMFSSNKFLGKSKRGHYGDMIGEMGWAVGEILRTLEDADLARRTLVLFLSDNGPHLELCAEGGSSGFFHGGKMSWYEGGFRVPAIAWWPGHIQGGQLTDSLISSLDIMPTLAELAGVQLPRQLIVDGMSFTKILANGKNSSRRTSLFYYCMDRLMAVRYKLYKLLYYSVSVVSSEFFQTNCTYGIPHNDIYESAFYCYSNSVKLNDPPLLFDIEKDPAERFPLSLDAHASIVNEIEKEVEIHKSELVPGKPLLGPEFVNPALQPCCQPPNCSCNF